MSEYHEYQDLLDRFVQQSRDILDGRLVGVYLHGSAAMGCFHPQRSDIDLLVVVKDVLSNEWRRRYMDTVAALNRQAPAKGLELSVVRAGVCNPFVHPTPFELHFSIAHLDWYLSDPEDCIGKMRGTDRDLAAHVTVIRRRGIVLYGREIKEVFSEVSGADYFDSIWGDIENAEREITGNFMYLALNLCRVLAYKEEHAVLSKQEGGQWGLAHIPPRYAGLISAALAEYQAGRTAPLDGPLAKEYAGYMLERIKRT